MLHTLAVIVAGAFLAIAVVLFVVALLDVWLADEPTEPTHRDDDPWGMG